MSPRARAVYVSLLVIAMVFLGTAYFDPEHPLLHQAGTTGCLGLAILIAAVSEIRKNGIKRYLISGLFRDLGIAIMWGILLAIWVMFPDAGLNIY
ncbi:MAG: hypothetical protein MJ186_00840 [Clostridia bacterium]|nr:hypothetical protein [Clostridia bacterium]